MATLILLYIIFGSATAWGHIHSKKDSSKTLPKFVRTVSALILCILALCSSWIIGSTDYKEVEDDFHNDSRAAVR